MEFRTNPSRRGRREQYLCNRRKSRHAFERNLVVHQADNDHVQVESGLAGRMDFWLTGVGGTCLNCHVFHLLEEWLG